MRIPIHRLRKSDLVWLATHRCKAHSHDFLSHYHCFLKERPDTSPIVERLAVVDIESSDLNAQWGFILSYCVKEVNGPILGRVITPKELTQKSLDKELLRECIADLNKFDRVIVHWGKSARFDLPMIRARALKHRLNFPLYKEILVTDTWDMSKAKLCLKTNSLKAICNFLEIPSKGKPLNPEVWICAIVRHDPKALKYIYEHNVEDVKSTEEVWKRLSDYMPNTRTSI